MKARFLVPLGVFLVLVVLLGVGLTLDPRDVPSVLIDKKASEFSLRDLFDPDKTVDSASMKGKVWLVNVWGTWCPECWREHEFLLYLAKPTGTQCHGSYTEPAQPSFCIEAGCRQIVDSAARRCRCAG